MRSYNLEDLCRKVEHPSYSRTDSGGLSYDFSLLLMEKNRGFNLPNLPNVEPACLPTQAVPRNVIVSEEGN